MKKKITYIEAINEAFHQEMESDERVIIIGEGVPDPKNIFGSTKGLYEKFGRSRVYDMPLSENGITGCCIGAAISGLRPIIVHQRLDFALLSLDQIINNAAKWFYMFNGQSPVPMVIRMIIGRGWGQGPQHAQSYQSFFAHIPGLKVVMPSSPADAKGLMLAAIRDNNPVIFIEHRWLHNSIGYVPEKAAITSIGKCKILKKGSDITLVGISFMVIESIIAANILKEVLNIKVEVIDVRTLRPFDFETIIKSVKKTKYLIIADTDHEFCGFASEILSTISQKCFKFLNNSPVIVASPNYSSPTSHALMKNYYPTAKNIVDIIVKTLKLKISKLNLNLIEKKLKRNSCHDVPDQNFKGPF